MSAAEAWLDSAGGLAEDGSRNCRAPAAGQLTPLPAGLGDPRVGPVDLAGILA